MPYINQERRESLAFKYPHHPDDPMDYWLPETPGELNYVLTLAITDYMEDKELNYQTLNDVMGALEGAKQEFYRRIVAPYEDEKMEDNGDVYDTIN